MLFAPMLFPRQTSLPVPTDSRSLVAPPLPPASFPSNSAPPTDPPVARTPRGEASDVGSRLRRYGGQGNTRRQGSRPVLARRMRLVGQLLRLCFGEEDLLVPLLVLELQPAGLLERLLTQLPPLPRSTRNTMSWTQRETNQILGRASAAAKRPQRKQRFRQEQ